MLVSEIKTALKFLANVADTDPLLTWINAAYHEFERAYSWSFLDTLTSVSVVALDDTPTLPVDFLKLKSIKIADQLGYLQYIGFRRLQQEKDPMAVGEPSHYSFIGNTNLYLWPVPDKNYTLKLIYRKFLTDLAADGDTPGIPAMYHYSLVKGAAGYGLGAEGEEERVNAHRTSFLDDIEEARGIFGELQEAQFGTVRNSQDY